MGRDKVESDRSLVKSKQSCPLIPIWRLDEELIKYAWPQDVWFHVDKLSSAHVYLRMPDSISWDSIPEALLTDCAQLVKANSIEGSCFQRHINISWIKSNLIKPGNKKDNITIIYTPGDNLKVCLTFM